MRPSLSAQPPRSVPPGRLNRILQPLPVTRLIRAGALLVLIALLGSGIYSVSSATSAKQNPAAADAVARRSYPKGAPSGIAPASPASAYRPLLTPLFSGTPTIQTFAGDCSTPKTVFDVQDSDKTVCAHVTGGSFFWQLIWSNANFVAVQTNPITSDPQDITFTLSSTSSLGDWRVILFEPFGGTVQAVTAFTVVDSGNPVADLAISTSTLNETVAAGSQAIFSVQVTNFGPSAASNVQLTDAVPANTSFVSYTQVSGPVFSCSNPSAGGTGTTTCTVATLNRGDTALFLATYQVDNSVTTGTVISDTSNVTSDTFDNHTGASSTADDNNNTSTATATAVANPCVITPPANIDVPADTGQAGAVVTYSDPTFTGNCGSTGTFDENGNPIPVISCNPPSGSFFSAGTSTVLCTSQTGTSATFLVTVENPGGLSITLNGANPLAVECGDDFADPGATAVDANGQSVPVTITNPTGFDPSAPATGTYTITYTATEGSNSTSTTRTVTVADTKAPDITVAGANPYKIELGTCLPFVDPGVSASDACAGSEPVTSTISGPGGLTSIDTNTAGTYTITYTASDGTHTGTATRTVLVGNFPPDEANLGNSVAPPVIKLLGGDSEAHTVTAECGTFVDPGATATTACGSPLTYTVTGTVDSHTPGSYTLTYTTTDPSNNLSASVTRVVIITPDATAPVITLNGTTPMTVECHTTFTDPGAVAHDACAGDFAATASGTVDANTPGTYTITYNATDPSGHAATPVTRTVNVVDTTAPVVTPPAAVTLQTGANGTSCGVTVSNLDGTLGTATATDSCQGALPTTRSGVPSGNFFPVGQTTLTYSATDANGNTGSATQVVTVVDTTPPAISCPVNITVYLPLNTTATSTVVNYTPPVGTDNCGGATTTQTAGLPSGASFPVGTTTNTFTVTDASNNTASCSFTVTVLYDFTGFFSPVMNPPTLNVVKAGSGIPVKFSLSGNKGLNIFAVGFPVDGSIPCDATAPVVDLTATVTAGGSSLSYDAGSDQYNYVWKTDSSWAGTCRQLQVKLNDGSVHVANFKFK
jgi:uncharacterized repeat protein (TIGR01451 family)